MTAPSIETPVRPANGMLTIRSELWTASPDGTLKEDITEALESATVAYAWDEDVPGTLDARIRGRDAVEAITDCLVPFLTVEWLDAKGARQQCRRQLGHFFFLPPDREYSRTLQMNTVRGLDATWALGQLTLAKNYVLRPNSYLYGSWARDMFRTAGRTELRTDLPLTGTRPWKTLTFLPNTYARESINDVYRRAGYWPVIANREGVLFTEPHRYAYQQEPARIVSSRDGDVVIGPGVQLVPDREAFFNQIFLASNNPADTLEMRDGYRATLVDPDSPYSVQNLGYIRSYSLADNRDDSFTVMRRRALGLLERSTSMMARLTLATLPDPRFEPRAVWELDVRMDTGTVMGRGKWRVESTRFALAQDSAAQITVCAKLSDVSKVS